VELDADGGEEGGRLLGGSEVGIVGEQWGESRDGPQDRDVAQATVALLQVGLEEKGDVAGRLPPLLHGRLEDGEIARPQLGSPGGLGLLDEGLGHLGLAPDHARIEEAEGNTGVLGGGAEHLGGPPHRVVQVDPLVPHGVPDAVGHRLDVAAPVVDEHDIEVAVGAERATPVAADGDQGEVAPALPGGPIGQSREPGVRLGGVAAAELLAHQPWLGQQIGAPVPQ
jgi:hypothetical protein